MCKMAVRNISPPLDSCILLALAPVDVIATWGRTAYNTPTRPHPSAPPVMASIGRETMVKIALEHARKAVELDTQAGSPRDAVDKYAMCVSLLNKVIEAMYRDGTESEKTVDIARLVTIHNSYLDRIASLCNRHTIPMPSTTSSNPLRR